MASISLVLIMLLAVLVSGFVVRLLPFSLPLPIVQIVLGGVIASLFHRGVVLQPEVFFLLFLPPLLFLDGWRIPKDGLFRDGPAILQLALGLVVFTVVGAGFLIHWMIPALPLAVAFALAAIVSPTDPVAVSAIASRAPVPKRLMHLLEGESLLNDASGLVCFQFAVAAALTGSFSMAAATSTFVWVALVGFACGVLITLAVTHVQQWLSRRFGEEDGSSILISLLIPFGAYLLAEHVEASGILAAVGAGITMSYVERRGGIMANTRLQRTAVWNTVQFTLNGVMFVLLGEQLPGIFDNAMATINEVGKRSAWWLLIYAVALTVGLAVLRYLWVWLSLRINLRRHRREVPQISHRLVLATSLAGVRGAITLAGILTLPLLMPDGSPFPARSIAIFLAAAVIALSLLAASIGLPLLLRDLDVPDESAAEQEEDHVRALMAQAAIRAIKTAQETTLQQVEPDDVEIHVDAATRAVAFYQVRADMVATDTTDPRRLRKADAVERALHMAALQGQRVAIVKHRRRHQVSEELAHKLLHEIDLTESRYQ